MRFERLVVGVDFSAHSIEAAQWVAARFAPGVELVLVHVTPSRALSPSVPTRWSSGIPLIDPVREAAERRLRQIRLSPKPDFVWCEIRQGDPAECLTRVAEEFSADAIVVGAGDERSDPLASFGAMAEQLVRLSTCPVLTAACADLTPLRASVASTHMGASTAGRPQLVLDPPSSTVPARSSAR